MQRFFITAIIVLAVIGLLSSLLLVRMDVIPVRNGPPITCSVGNNGCKAVSSVKQASILGIPAPVIGSLYFGFLIVLSIIRLATDRWLMPQIMILILLGGFIYSIYLTYLMFFVLSTVCPYCLTAHTANLLLIILAIADIRIIMPGRIVYQG